MKGAKMERGKDKNIRTMTIVVRKGDPDEIVTLIGDNLAGDSLFHQNQIEFLEDVLKKLKAEAAEEATYFTGKTSSLPWDHI